MKTLITLQSFYDYDAEMKPDSAVERKLLRKL